MYSLRSFAVKIFLSKIAKRARLELEARTCKNVVTGKNYLPPASAKNSRKKPATAILSSLCLESRSFSF